MKSFSASVLFVVLLQVSSLLDMAKAMENQDVYDEFYDAIEDATARAALLDTFQTIALKVILPLTVAFALIFWWNLREKDSLLPEDKRFMTIGMKVTYWVVCLFFGWLGVCIFYFIAREKINARIQLYSVTQSEIPVAIEEKTPEEKTL